MSISFELHAEVRQERGKGANRRLRRADRVPAILYGGHTEPLSVVLSATEVARQLKREGFYSTILNLKIDGRSERVVLKDLHRHPSRPVVLHMDFLRVKDKDVLRIHVPLNFVGGNVSPGVKVGGGMETHHAIEVEVSCLAKDLPEHIDVDLSGLGLGESIRLSELQLPEGVTLVELSHGPERDIAVAGIQSKREVSGEESEEAGEAGGEAEME